MKKVLPFLTFCFLLSFGLQAQYFYNTYTQAGINPGGLNTDLEYPVGGGLTTGWTTILGPQVAAPAWSPVQNIPFSFSFNGTVESQYKVSSNGVLTFTTAATTVPGAQAALPSSNVPDKSVCMWGISLPGTNDQIVTKTFGTAPNRQHWIFFTSAQLGNGWSYWSIVLEEGSNKIYVVDQRHSGTTGGLSIGVQIDATDAASVGANVTPLAGADPTAADNVYYEFINGIRPADEAELVSTTLNSTEVIGSAITIGGDIKNNGTNTLNSLIVNWSNDAMTTINRDTLSLNLATGVSSSFSHQVTWNPSTGGQLVSFDIWIEEPNGVADTVNVNDSLKKDVFTVLGNSVQKNVLLEEFTTSVCQFCPDGTYTMEQILNSNPNVIGVGVHAGFGTDSMTIPEHISYASAFTTSAPAAVVDRIKYENEDNVAFSSRQNWATRANAQSTVGSPLTMNLTGSYNQATRSVSLTADMSFVDYIFPGDVRVTLYVVEDSVSKRGPQGQYFQGWDQVNAYYGTVGHPYYQVGLATTTPGLSIIQGFEHRHVLRDVYPTTDAWGDNSVIPTQPALNTNYTKSYTFNIPGAWDENQISFVAFVSYYDQDVEMRQVINAEEIKLNSIVSVSEINSAKKQELTIYPNPTSDFTNVEFQLEETNNVSVEVLDITGKVLISEGFGTMVQGKQRVNFNVSDLANGFYFVNLRIGEEVYSRKISVNK